jgi:hypothetical protein
LIKFYQLDINYRIDMQLIFDEYLLTMARFQAMISLPKRFGGAQA